jgi:hypothetical protein
VDFLPTAGEGKRWAQSALSDAHHSSHGCEQYALGRQHAGGRVEILPSAFVDGIVCWQPSGTSDAIWRNTSHPTVDLPALIPQSQPRPPAPLLSTRACRYSRRTPSVDVEARCCQRPATTAGLFAGRPLPRSRSLPAGCIAPQPASPCVPSYWRCQEPSSREFRDSRQPQCAGLTPRGASESTASKATARPARSGCPQPHWALTLRYYQWCCCQCNLQWRTRTPWSGAEAPSTSKSC